MEAQRTRPSIGRWYILFLISLMYLITYLDRVNISTVAPVISKEFGFDKVTMGIIFSAFVWAYALFQVPGGWLNDRFGPRRVLAIIVAYWSVMTAATAAATGRNFATDAKPQAQPARQPPSRARIAGLQPRRLH
jgi:sugar phosphate permease